MERLVETALGQAGDFAGAAQWRRALAHLSAGVRIAVVGVDPRSVRDAVASIPDAITPVPLVFHDNADDIAEALLGVHAAVWATPASGPLSATERMAMQDLDPWMPRERAVLLTRLNVLARLSDTPQSERIAVETRVESLCRDGWTCPHAPREWMDDLLARRSGVAEACRVRVATVVLTSARVHTDLNLADMGRTSARLQDDVDRLRAQDADARAQASETARHVLGSLVRHTTVLTHDWRRFTAELGEALPRELTSIPKDDLTAEVVTTWLGHILDTWLTRASDQWENDLAADLEGVASDPWLSALHLLTIPVTVSGIARTPGWRHRLLVTGALGGGATLAVAGFWTPGLTLVAGGAALAGLRRLQQASTREQLIAATAKALATVADQQQAVLTQQTERLQDAIQQLENHHADMHDDALRAAEAALHDAQAQFEERHAELLANAELLDCRLAEIQESA